MSLIHAPIEKLNTLLTKRKTPYRLTSTELGNQIFYITKKKNYNQSFILPTITNSL